MANENDSEIARLKNKRKQLIRRIEKLQQEFRNEYNDCAELTTERSRLSAIESRITDLGGIFVKWP